jgi:outer membrane receptor for ferrienterochelin and colicins
MFKLWLRVSVAATCFTPTALVANVDSMVLDTVVVTGTRSERKLLDVPVRTEVISRREIQQIHARDLAEALRHQPGLLLKDIHGKGGTEVWLQGLDSDRVLVLIDGRPVSASTGSTVDLSQIATVDIERIEIVKGAVSALYGSAAMGGVVNVISRQSEQPLSYQIQLDAGSYGDKALDGDSALGSRHVNAAASVYKPSYKGSFAVDFRDSDGFDLDSSTYSFEGDQGSKLNISADVAFSVRSNTTLEYSSSFYEEDIERNFSTFSPGQGDIQKIDAENATRFNHTLSWDHSLAKGATFKGYLMNETFDNTTEQDVVVTPVTDQQRLAKINTLKTEVQLDWPLGENQLLTVGAVAFDSTLKQRQERTEGNQLVEIEEITPGAGHQNVELFVQNSIFIGEKWEFIPGLRLQEDSDFDSHIAPKINIMYVPGFAPELNPRLRFGLGSGYRVPNLKERYFLFDHSANGYVVLGNTELQPEASDSVQLGFEMSLSDSARGEISLFYNKFRDLIATSEDEVASAEQQLQVFRYSNIASARTQGVDLSLAQRINKQISFDVAYTWLDAVDRDTGSRLTGRPEHQVNLGMDFTLPKTKSSITLKALWRSYEFVDSENLIRSPGYATVDLKLNQPVGERLVWFLGVDNILDEHLDPDNFGQDFRPKQGRFTYAGLRYSL